MKEKHPSAKTIHNVCGSWNKAKEEAGLEIIPKSLDHDLDYFREIDRETSYWLGFICADGYIATDPTKLEIQLAEKDQHHIELFQKHIGSTHAINRKLSGKGIMCSHVQIGVERFADPLLEIFGEDKTFSDSIPELSEDLNCHFVRGIFDGDGHARPEKKKICITGHGPRLEKVSDLIPVETSVDYSDHIPTEDLAVLRAYGDSATKMANWMYPERKDTEPKLDRKFPKWF